MRAMCAEFNPQQFYSAIRNTSVLYIINRFQEQLCRIKMARHVCIIHTGSPKLHSEHIRDRPVTCFTRKIIHFPEKQICSIDSQGVRRCVKYEQAVYVIPKKSRIIRSDRALPLVKIYCEGSRAPGLFLLPGVEFHQ